MNMSVIETKAMASLSMKAESLVESLKGMRSAVQRTDLVTTKVTNPESGKAYTSKDKKVLGVPEENNIIWSHPHFDKVTHSVLLGVAKTIEKPVAQMVAEIVMAWVEENREELEEVGSAYVRGEDDEATLQRKLDAAKRQMERLQALMNSKK